jgi:hypothetical protein
MCEVWLWWGDVNHSVPEFARAFFLVSDAIHERRVERFDQLERDPALIGHLVRPFSDSSLVVAALTNGRGCLCLTRISFWILWIRAAVYPPCTKG